ncbi:unnamed protein product [Owenia fusiformis]|uniref:Uncharacterized protein n=1 Tax=Owenia fusiformis TaxID=6347 RepID=A0A8J1Y215_OWEFU|nr:unnamed protein product [Owenia fusiformis]
MSIIIRAILFGGICILAVECSIGHVFHKRRNTRALNVTYAMPFLSVDECAVFCASTDGCTHFNFRKLNGNDTCNLLKKDCTIAKGKDHDYDLWHIGSRPGLIYVGCTSVTDSKNNNYHDNNMTIYGCVDYCASRGFRYAKAYEGFRCMCGGSINWVEEYENGCTTTCIGNSSQICGGASSQYLSTYLLTY